METTTNIDMNSVKVFIELYGIKAAVLAKKIGMQPTGFSNNFNPKQTSTNFTPSQKEKTRSYLLDMQRDLAKLLKDNVG